MASRPKRKRTANKCLDPPATSTQPSASASSEDMTTLLQLCMSRIMPTIEDTFKTCIADYFSNTSPTATPQPQPLEHPAAIQPPTLLHEITGGNPVPSSAAGKQVDSDPPQTLSALSLTLGVDQKTRAKIHSDEYVKFASLLKSNDPDNVKVIKLWRKMGNCFFKKHLTNSRSLQSINGSNAFMFLWQFMPKNTQTRYPISWPTVKLFRKFPKPVGTKQQLLMTKVLDAGDSSILQPAHGKLKT